MSACPHCDGTGQVEPIWLVTFSDGETAHWPDDYRDGFPLPSEGDTDPDEGLTVVSVVEVV